ncbi:hypothetical protein GCM10023093_22410 [Nemorincola caseinilytica]|uniref:Uncharacterized protein n=2 Tax=Nemorincola caseinilytica TaxID=2054315 RepID=A0ABP8NK25_9BACT
MVFLLMMAAVSYGKQGRGMERIHAAKMAYITDRLKLQADQSVRFVPVYNEYEQDLRAIRKQYMKKYNVKDVDGKTRENKMAARQKLEEDLDYQQQVIELKRRYNDRFLKVLSQEQLSDLYVAEKEFRQLLMQRLKQRERGPRQHR